MVLISISALLMGLPRCHIRCHPQKRQGAFRSAPSVSAPSLRTPQGGSLLTIALLVRLPSSSLSQCLSHHLSTQPLTSCVAPCSAEETLLTLIFAVACHLSKFSALLPHWLRGSLLCVIAIAVVDHPSFLSSECHLGRRVPPCGTHRFLMPWLLPFLCASTFQVWVSLFPAVETRP